MLGIKKEALRALVIRTGLVLAKKRDVILIAQDATFLQALAKLVPLTMALTFGKSVVNVTSDDLLSWQSSFSGDSETFSMLVNGSELLVWENVTTMPGVRKVEGRIVRMLSSRRERGGVTLATALADLSTRDDNDDIMAGAFWSELESLHGRAVASYLESFKVVELSYRRAPEKVERWVI